MAPLRSGPGAALGLLLPLLSLPPSLADDPPKASIPVSAARLRQVGSYSFVRHAPMDAFNVTVRDNGRGRLSVIVHGAVSGATDASVRRSSHLSAQQLHARDLSLQPPLVLLDPEGRMRPWRAKCAPEHVYVVRAERWDNAFRFLEDAVALARHISTTPAVVPADPNDPMSHETVRPAQPPPRERRVLYVDAGAGARVDGRGVPVNRVTLVDLVLDALFASVRPASRLASGSRPPSQPGRVVHRCVAGFHWGIGARLLSPWSQGTFVDERRAAVRDLRHAVGAFCRVDPLLLDANQPPKPPPPRAAFRAALVRRAVDRSRRFYEPSRIGSLIAGMTWHNVTLRSCCDWRRPCEAVAKLADASVVVGVHGAGLANAVFAQRGAVLVEVKGELCHGSDVYRRVAQAIHGGYVAVHAKPVAPMPWSQGGLALSDPAARRVAACVGALLQHPRDRPRECSPIAAAADGRPYSTRGWGEGIEGSALVAHDEDCAKPATAVDDCNAGMCRQALGLPAARAAPARGRYSYGHPRHLGVAADSLDFEPPAIRNPLLLH